MRFAKIISTFLGVGYIKKGGGTVAAAITCLIWYLITTNIHINKYYLWVQIALILLIFFAGVWSGNKVEPIWGKDSYRVVLDEVLGMCISLVAVTANPHHCWAVCIVALLLFRIFDIFKPFYIKRLEYLPGGWGVMLDDVLAGVYVNIVLQIILMIYSL